MRTTTAMNRPEPTETTAFRPWTLLRRLGGLVSASLLLIALLATPVVGLAPTPVAPAGSAPDATVGDQPESAAGSAAAVPASRQATNIAVVTIREPIDSVTARSVARRIQSAESAGADALVIEIDTPGGEVGAVLDIATSIKSSSIPNTVAWIRPTAYSGGAIIALACREIVAAGTSRFGDSLVVSPLMALPEAERQKVTVPLIAEVVNSARLHGWDEYLVQAIVSRFIELWYVEDIETGERLCIDEAEYRMLFDGEPPRSAPRLAAASPNPNAPQSPTNPAGTGIEPEQLSPESPDYQAPSDIYGDADYANAIRNALESEGVRPLISEADRGRYRLLTYVCDGNAAVVFEKSGPVDDMAYFGFLSETIDTDEELKSYFGAENLTRLAPTWSERLVRLLTSLWVRGLLLVIFIVALFLEMSSPGLAIPGLVAAVALVMLLAPPYLIGAAGWWEFAAIGLGIAGILLEVFILPGFGFFGVVGLLLLLGGMLGTFVPDPSQRFPGVGNNDRDLLFGITTLLMSFITAGGIIFFLAKRGGGLPFLNRLILQDPEPGDDDSPLDLLKPQERTPQIGDRGKAHTDLRPSGRAEMDGRLVDVVSGLGYIEAGEPVRVTAVEGFRVVVERDDAPESANAANAEPADGEHAE
ncbi:MAG: NfeD family protein [Planctomycetota bacterium]